MKNDPILTLEILLGMIIIAVFLLFMTGCTPVQEQECITVNTSHEFAILNSNTTGCLVFDKSVQEITNCTIKK